jgi:hypothetical protein
MTMIKKKLGRPAKTAVKPSYRQSESLQILSLEALIDNANFKIESLEHQAIGYKAVIDYLEHKLS